jgi:ABC-type cobalamin/Fe3+-siderophores transport system ATPase subunit
MNTPDRSPGKRERPLLGIVGPCASGKSTLVKSLSEAGITARHIAQEHSYVPDMWLRLSQPHFLVYLQVSYANTVKRRLLDWSEEDYHEQLHRLRHARLHADLIINTDGLVPGEVYQKVLSFIHSQINQNLGKPSPES